MCVCVCVRGDLQSTREELLAAKDQLQVCVFVCVCTLYILSCESAKEKFSVPCFHTQASLPHAYCI